MESIFQEVENFKANLFEKINLLEKKIIKMKESDLKNIKSNCFKIKKFIINQKNIGYIYFYGLNEMSLFKPTMSFKKPSDESEEEFLVTFIKNNYF